jgi:hypothetical protein
LTGCVIKINPGEAADKDLYDLPAEEAASIPTVASTSFNNLGTPMPIEAS